MSITSVITRLQSAKGNIASAIALKGGTIESGDGFEDFADAIATISGGGGGEVSELTPQADILIGKSKSALLTAFGVALSSTQMLFFYDVDGYLSSEDYYWWGQVSGKDITGTSEVVGGTTWTNGASYGEDDNAKLKQGRTYKAIIVSEAT